MRTWHQPNEGHCTDKLFLQEYEHFISSVNFAFAI